MEDLVCGEMRRVGLKEMVGIFFGGGWYWIGTVRVGIIGEERGGEEREGEEVSDSWGLGWGFLG